MDIGMLSEMFCPALAKKELNSLAGVFSILQPHLCLWDILLWDILL
jgi:hypothetical protein